MSSKVGRPDRRVVRTREALIEAGFALFAERGVHEVSIDEIVERAGISKQTFYNHFADKYALASTIYLDIRAQFEREVRDINATIEDPALRIARAICFYVRKALDDPDHVRFVSRMLVQDTSADNAGNRGLMADLAAGLDSGRFIVRSLESGAAFVLGAAEPLLAAVLAGNDIVDARAKAQEFLTMILRGLAMPPVEAERIAAQATNQVLRSGNP